MRKREFLFLILITLIVILLSACSQKNNDNLEIEKGLSEIRFLENQCIGIFNKYISDDYLNDERQIDWSLIEEDYIILENALDVILIDFASLKVNSKDIVELENYFNDLNIFFQSKDIDRFISRICDSYYLVSNSILDFISENENLKLEKRAKSNLLYVGFYLKKFDKNEATNYINKFQEDITKLNSSKEYIENNSYKINRIFISMQKLKLVINEDNLNDGKDILKELLEFF